MEIWEEFSSVEPSEGKLLGLGNPLLDITVHADLYLLKKYDLTENEAIIADEKHLPLYEELLKDFEPTFTAGGSVQNSLRVFQWLIKKPNVAVFMGAVGTDEYGKILQEKAESDGVTVKYQYHKEYTSGTCAVIVTNHHRTLCANLAAATHFQMDHILTPEGQACIQKAAVFYVSGFFLTVSPESAMAVAEHAAKHDKLLISNLSAPFICQLFSEAQTKLMPYIDVLFGNETEALMFAEVHDFKTDSIQDIALRIANLEKINKRSPRIVIITQGCGPVVVAKKDTIEMIPVPPIPATSIVDTNGAGDAFAGGFLSQLLQGKPLDKCVACGNWAAAQVIQRSGCTFDAKVQYHC